MNDLKDIPVELELKARMFQHKVAITSAKLVEDYKESQRGEINLPEFMTNEQAVEYAMKRVQEFLSKGTLNEEYERAYESLKDKLPENYSTLL